MQCSIHNLSSGQQQIQNPDQTLAMSSRITLQSEMFFHGWFVNLRQSTFPEQVCLNVVHFWLQQIGGDNAQGKVIPQVSLYENWFAVDVLERQNNPQKAKFGLGRSKILNVNFRKKSQKPARELAQAQCHLLSIPLPPG